MRTAPTDYTATSFIFHTPEISIAPTLFRWQKRLEPCTTRNRPATKVDMDALIKDIEKFPDDYQWERAKRLNVTQPGIHYALKRLKVSFEKKR